VFQNTDGDTDASPTAADVTDLDHTVPPPSSPEQDSQMQSLDHSKGIVLFL